MLSLDHDKFLNYILGIDWITDLQVQRSIIVFIHHLLSERHSLCANLPT
jgi:hypothetical protein